MAYRGVSIGSAKDFFTHQLPQTDASLLRLGRVISEACKRKLGLLLGWPVLLVALGTLLGGGVALEIVEVHCWLAAEVAELLDSRGELVARRTHAVLVCAEDDYLRHLNRG